MKMMIAGFALLLWLSISGCVNKGPYYIYGDYYEDAGAEEQPILEEKAGHSPEVKGEGKKK